MSPRLPLTVPRWPRWFVISEFCFAYTFMILNYIYGYFSGEIEMGFLLLSIMLFLGGCSFLLGLFTFEPRLSRRASIALVTIGLCLYAPLPFLVLQGYLRLTHQYARIDPAIDLAFVVITALVLVFISLIRLILYYKKIPVTETQIT
jgi:hypothetical protein